MGWATTANIDTCLWGTSQRKKQLDTYWWTGRKNFLYWSEKTINLLIEKRYNLKVEICTFALISNRHCSKTIALSQIKNKTVKLLPSLHALYLKRCHQNTKLWKYIFLDHLQGQSRASYVPRTYEHHTCSRTCTSYIEVRLGICKVETD